MTTTNDLYAFLMEKDLIPEINQYSCSYWEPLTTDSEMTLFSQEPRRLNQTEELFHIFDDNWAPYVKDEEADKTIEIVTDMQKNGLPKVPSGYLTDVPTVDMILYFSRFINDLGLHIYGRKERIFDKWKVVNDDKEFDAVKRDHSGMRKQFIRVQNADGPDTINDIYGNVLRVHDDSFDVSEEPNLYFFEIHSKTDKIGLSHIPLPKLFTVMVALEEGYSFQDISEQILWPNLSKDFLWAADLNFEKHYCSDAIEFTAHNSLDQMNKLEIHKDKFHSIDSYQYQEPNDGEKWGMPIITGRMYQAFEVFYHNKPFLTAEKQRIFSDDILSIAEDLGLTIVRRERRFLSADSVTVFSVDAEGCTVQAISGEQSAFEMIKPVFAVEKKGEPGTVKTNLSIEQLIEYVWLLNLNENYTGEGDSDDE